MRNEEAERKQAHYDEWIRIRACWAEHGHQSDDECEDGCGKPLTPSSIFVSNDGWFCDDCAEHFSYPSSGNDYEDFGADMGIGISDPYEPFDDSY